MATALDDPLLFTLAVLAILGTPGPTNSLLAAAGAAGGLRRALPLVPAEAAGYLISITTLGLVLGPVLAASPALATGLRLLLGAYLLLLAFRLGVGAGDPLQAARLVTPRQVFVTTLLNPKAILFALGVVPFGAARVWPYLLGFTGLLAAVALCWIAGGALLGRVAARRGRASLVPRLAAAEVAGFALLILAGPLLA